MFILSFIDDASFAVVLELKDDQGPSVSHGQVFILRSQISIPSAYISQDPPPWVAADKQHTTSGASDNAELHMLRAVDTGIINVSVV